MGWAAGLLGGGGATLVVGCLVGMGLLMWLLLRLTGDSSARIGGQEPRRVPAESSSEVWTGTDGRPRARPVISARAGRRVRVASPRDQPAADRDRAGPGRR
jgi:hypothetical protein